MWDAYLACTGLSTLVRHYCFSRESDPGSIPTSGEIPVLVRLCGLPGPTGKACRWQVPASG